MSIHLTIQGNVQNLHVIEVKAPNTTVVIGGSNKSETGFSKGDLCPLKTTKEQRTQWGTACAVDHKTPEGWTAETFSSEKAFTNNVIPSGLTKGDAIFYWKKGVDENDEPASFKLVWLKDSVAIIVPASASESIEDTDDDDLNSDGDLSGDDGIDFDGIPTSLTDDQDLDNDLDSDSFSDDD